MQPRYFIGITLSEHLSNRISEMQRELLIPGSIMEPLVPHITLLDPNILMTLAPLYFVPRVKNVGNKLLPLEIKLENIGLFHEQVLYIRIESPELLTLQAQLAELLPDKIHAQYSLGRRFVPHITLAQAKPKQALPPSLIDNYINRTKDFLPDIFTATHLTKFMWQSSRTYRLEKI